MSIERALELVDRSPGNGYPNPTVGAVVVAADGTTLGEGVTEPAGGRHAEVVALDEAGAGAGGATLFVTMEPCAHHGRTPPCVDRILESHVARVVAGCRDPSPSGGGGAVRLRQAGVETELLDLREARRQNEAWRTWAALGRPYVILKLALSVDGRAAVPRRRWVSGVAARRRVHELRASVDAVGVGMGTVHADAPRLDARDVPVVRPPRRLAFGRGPLPDGSELELRSGRTEEELGALAAEGVQSLLLEGGPTIAASFLAHGWVDRLLVFVAPVLAGGGPAGLGELPEPLDLGEPTVELVGADVLLDWRLRDEV
ncbi:MAG TPA: bifunctional diaminohydroxyphosphoribosylaminopyrimidine deaminase/5-amino-6-(5-phosphoribosylamino)uracil reductase RibD [Gaiella sp.]|uniref:bifunctional diaminohydroxyphosphoribosylaminopyrimidine deaminase/5-amino-6-(5-phosphoribosylamino)uracil reductase RibD n=1 Tax=Gaiella sp. TaxID=2663207 RepID=UPI002D7E3C59|nr:bifunctional diaminohydroxyphosphoribosylaminopyrimidine deaminase/5-amino-6-(5-phosphoribosylamino)uracil reductase RibD [Gaiella sp.]HET9287669.1 bifunctional diaminohydroxyphosphoribosylaminopyrimidine deaminase/5-amino-6-(5-phosphoribosylamino)uracil reductase RibD [Gaiella sp.]